MRNLRFLGEGASGDDAADFEEALALGLDRSDLVVRRRLVQRLELQAQAWARASEPSEAELAALLAREPERFALPERTRLSHVFLSRDRHGRALAAADARSRSASRRSRPSEAPGSAIRSCSGTISPRARRPSSRRASASRSRAPSRRCRSAAGAARSPSSYGVHHVFVHERTPARAARLGEVRSAVREAVFAERAERVLADWLRELRSEAS